MLFSIGLVFMAVAAVDYMMGSQQQIIQLPRWLQGRFEHPRRRHRALPPLHHRRLRRARRRAAARSCRGPASAAACARRSTTRAWRAGSASTSSVIFAATFAVGSGLAGLGGALGAEILGLDPTFPLKFMIYFLIVVAVGGTTEHHRPAPRRAAARHRRRRGQVLRARARRLHHLHADDRRPDPAPAGPVRAGAMSRCRTRTDDAPSRRRVGAALAGAARWRVAGDRCSGSCAVAALFLLPERALILNEIAILALFARLARPDPRLRRHRLARPRRLLRPRRLRGRAVRQARRRDPLVGLVVAARRRRRCSASLTSFLVLRGTDLTRLMVTLGVALVLYELANQAAWLTGGADGLQGVVMGPLLGAVRVRHLRPHRLRLQPRRAVRCCSSVARRLVHSPFGLSLRAIRDNPLRAAAIGIPVNRRLVAVYTLAAAYAGAPGALLAQTTQFASLDVLDFHRSADVLLVLVIGGTGYLYGGLDRRGRVQAAAGRPVRPDAAVLEVLDRPVPGRPRARRPRAPDRAERRLVARRAGRPTARRGPRRIRPGGAGR